VVFRILGKSFFLERPMGAAIAPPRWLASRRRRSEG
jgi:hypothetical protein